MMILIIENNDDDNNTYNKNDINDNSNVLVLGEDWNKQDKTEKTPPDGYKYKHTYSVNLWDLIYRDIIHSHNFTVYTL